jgi:hypothetical protein
MMDHPRQTTFRFFKIIGRGQAYINLLYLLAAFPLGVFYFTFLASGLSAGISLLIIWVGIPILLLMGAGWWILASFERFLAIHLLKEDIPGKARPSNKDTDFWNRFKAYCTNPVTWQSPIYLFLKFPLGIATFAILVTLTALTLVLMTMPFAYPYLAEFQVGIFFNPGLPAWQIDSMNDALLCSLIGLILWPVTLHVGNGLAWVHAKFAKLMLSMNPNEWLAVIVEA